MQDIWAIWVNKVRFGHLFTDLHLTHLTVRVQWNNKSQFSQSTLCWLIPSTITRFISSDLFMHCITSSLIVELSSRLELHPFNQFLFSFRNPIKYLNTQIFIYSRKVCNNISKYFHCIA